MLIWISILSVLCAAALWFLMGRPRFLPASTETSAKKISIVIPARDEESNIRQLLESIQQQTRAPHETIVINDDSSDNTATVARSLGAKVIDSEPLPPDWKGKPWACQQGADAASGEWLLFLDADTRLLPETIARLGHLTTESNHTFSICPWHHIQRPYEELSVFFNTLMVIGMKAFGANTTTQNDTRLVGQCMLIERDTYQRCGGHAAVKSETLENYHFSEVLKSQGVQRSCYLGKNSLSMRMFPGGFTELWRSWKKGFASGAAQVPPSIIAWTSVWITGMMMATVTLVITLITAAPALAIAAAATAYLVHALLCLWIFKQVGSFSWYNALLFPVSLIFYHVLFFAAIIDGKRGRSTPWKGREVS